MTQHTAIVTGVVTSRNISCDINLQQPSSTAVITDDTYAVPAAEVQLLTALHWISRFGWLRARELGALMFPEPGKHPGAMVADEKRMNTQRKMVNNKIIAKLKQARYVLSRSLPNRAGDALVLSAAGAHYLQRRLVTTARPGDKWGRSIDGRWTPPASWEHELIVTVTMLYFLSLGADIKTELELRAENHDQRKYPDGIAVLDTTMKDGSPVELVLWIEVESADKSGLKMISLARYLTKVYRGQAPVLSGLKATFPAVVYRSDLVNLSGRKVDHKNRITNAVQRHIGADFYLYFMQITFKPNAAYHADKIAHQPIRIYPLDPDDPKTEIRAAFTPTRNGDFINTSIDSKDRYWKLKVYRYHDRYRYEVWTAPEPTEGEPELKAGYQIEQLEEAFRAAMRAFQRKFYGESY